MRPFVRRLTFLVLALAGCVAAVAQPAPMRADSEATGQTSRADSAASGLSAAFESSLAGYRRFEEVPLLPWVQANEVVKAAGGWRAYAREAQQPQPAGDASAPAAERGQQRR